MIPFHHDRVTRRGGYRRAIVCLVGATAVLAGCSSAASSPRHATRVTVPLPVLQISPDNGAQGVSLDAPVGVGVAGGRLHTVELTRAGDAPGAAAAVPASRRSDRWWQTTAPLAPGVTYTVRASAVGPGGGTVRRTATFTTLTPVTPLRARVSPLDTDTVGVGMPLAVYLTAPVHDHASLESRLTVTSTPPVEGGWHWFSDSELHWRPRTYWPPHTAVTFSAALNGFDAGNGTWGVADRLVHFTIGSAQVSTVDVARHQMTVTADGAVVRVLPVSTGRDKYPTNSGIHVVSTKEQTVTMDSATVGIPRDSPDGYLEQVSWNVRISNSGEFVHAAPWSVSDQGRRNVSHGCVNLSTADAKWFFGFSRRGDVVKVDGPSPPLEPTNGFGDWNIPWEHWVG